MIQVCRERRKLGAQVDVQTPDQTALHPLTPSHEKSSKMRGERWRWRGEESALEVLKLDFSRERERKKYKKKQREEFWGERKQKS